MTPKSTITATPSAVAMFQCSTRLPKRNSLIRANTVAFFRGSLCITSALKDIGASRRSLFLSMRTVFSRAASSFFRSASISTLRAMIFFSSSLASPSKILCMISRFLSMVHPGFIQDLFENFPSPVRPNLERWYTCSRYFGYFLIIKLLDMLQNEHLPILEWKGVERPLEDVLALHCCNSKLRRSPTLGHHARYLVGRHRNFRQPQMVPAFVQCDTIEP